MFLSVGFVYRSVTRGWFSTFTVTSKKLSLSSDISELNLMLFHALRYWINVFNSSSPSFHTMNILSMYLNQTVGLKG